MNRRNMHIDRLVRGFVMFSAAGTLYFQTSILCAQRVQSEIEPRVFPEVPIRKLHGDPLASGRRSYLGVPKSDAKAQVKKNPWFLLQFKGPIRRESIRRLQKEGVEFHDYFPFFSYIVKLDPKALEAIRVDKDVRWIGAYEPNLKIDPACYMSRRDPRISWKRGAHERGPPLGGKQEYFVGLHADESATATDELIRKLDGETVRITQCGPRSLGLHIRLSEDHLVSLASNTSVLWVTPAANPTKCNNVVAGSDSLPLCDVRSIWDSHGLYGEGQVIGIMDCGLCDGSNAPEDLPDDFEDGNGSSRILAILDIAMDGAKADLQGHGTHVTGSALGNGKLSGSDPASFYFPTTCFAGMAPRAQGLVLACAVESASRSFYFPNGLLWALIAAKDPNPVYKTDIDGADLLLANMETGVTPGIYGPHSKDVDAFMWLNKDFFILVPAGNGGKDVNPLDGKVDPDWLGSPATAKNALTVGASETMRTSAPGFRNLPDGAHLTWAGLLGGLLVEPFFSVDTVMNNPAGMCYFSARGPCDDGRYKPDVVIPGSAILSVRHPGTTPPGGVYSANPNYSWSVGTSMSAGLGIGMAALVREYFCRGHYPGITEPSAALIKAVMISGAEDMAPGQYSNPYPQEIPDPPVPNSVEGWGRVNVERSLFAHDGAGFRVFGTDVNPNHTLGTGEMNEFEVFVKGGSPLRVLLVWTDYPSADYSAGLVNDLDLDVLGPNGELFYPNNANDGGLGGCYDHVNNVVGVDLNPQEGTYTIRVSGFNVVQDEANGYRQPYAVVVTGDLPTMKQQAVWAF